MHTSYARSGDVHIAYQVVGDGPLDLVVVPGFVTNVELLWELPEVRRSLEQLASFARVILFDKRGTGLSDRDVGAPTIEERIDDVRAVMDAAISERAALFGVGDGGPMTIVFAASYPERARALVLYHTFARLALADDYPCGVPLEALQAFAGFVQAKWGTGQPYAAVALPRSQRDAPEAVAALARFERQSASPGTAGALARMYADVDVRAALPAVRTPTLVVHRADDPVIPIEAGRFLAAHIDGSRFVEVGPSDLPVWVTDADSLSIVQEFLTGTRPLPPEDRVLASVLFTDVVSSTAAAAAVGDRRWRHILEAHNDTVAAQIGRYRGRLVKQTGDGILATFDGPARAVRCALAIGDALRPIGVRIRAGVHTGEIEVLGGDIAGIGVHIARRIADLADAGEVLVSRTVTDLVAGSGLSFSHHSTQQLRGVPGEWQMYAVSAPP